MLTISTRELRDFIILPTFLSVVLFSHVVFILYSFVLLSSIVLPCA